MTTKLPTSAEENHLGFLQIYPNIETFTKELTEDQWRSLLSGTPDNVSLVLLAKFILDILTCVSKKFKSTEIVPTEEKVQNMLGNTLPQIIADVLHIEAEVHSDTSQQLNKLLSKEVTDILNCDASGSTSHITPPSKLNTIILQTFKMLKEFPGKMKKIRFLKKKKLIKLHDGDSFRFLMSKYFTQKDDQSTTAEAALRSSLTEELQKILTPFLQAIPEDQAKMVLSETSQEVEVIIHYITGNELPFQAALAELRAFFIKSFAKALIHNKVAEMKTKFPTTSSVKRKKSLQLLANNVESLLKDLEAEKEDQGLRLVSRAERSGFTEALVGVIYSHVIEDSEHQVKAEGPDPHDPQCSDVHVAVRENVKNILVLLGWWSDTQAGNCCDRVLLTLNCLKSQPRDMDTQEYSDVHNDELPDANIHPKHYVKSRLRSKDHVTSRPRSKDHVDSRLRSKDHVDSRLRSKDHVDSRLRSKDHVDSRLRSKDHVASRLRSKDHVDSRLRSKDHVASRPRSKNHVASRLRSKDQVDSRLRSKDHVDSRLRSKDNVASRPRSKNHVDSRLRSKDHVASCLRSKDHVDAVILSDHEDMDASLYNSEYANVSAHHEHEEVLCDYFDDKDMMLVEREKCKTFVCLLIELLVWKLVKQAKNFGHDTETVIQRLSEATWINLEGSDPSLFEPNRLNGLKNQVYKKLCKEFGCAENLLFHLSLNDEAVQDCTVAIISSQLKMQKKPSMATKFVSWLKRVFTGCCR